jgi:hypothetical protein
VRAKMDGVEPKSGGGRERERERERRTDKCDREM